MRCAADRDERDVVSAHGDIGFAHRAVHDEFARRRFERVRDQAAVDLYHLRILVDARARVAEVAAGRIVEHPDTEFLDDAQRGVVDRLDPVVAERGLMQQRVLQMAVINLAPMRAVGDTVVTAPAAGSFVHASWSP